MQRQRTIETYSNGQLVDTRTETFTTSAEYDNDETIRADALGALAGNRTYIARASPTTAQTNAQVKALSQQNNRLIRLLLGLLDGTD